ncbi:hypothetical protein FSS13T_08760 [Flavobacterium saliperosum S13]|uniref:Uncharacterized protein n=1 Tax=Flavobacterium saliperosum S13 TaxID=1341155 RepID=A0ABP3A418_9FLAO|nr:hypothetical protein FSS13T_08760 [Flavobacterium saliperosum S13]
MVFSMLTSGNDRYGNQQETPIVFQTAISASNHNFLIFTIPMQVSQTHS